MDAATRWMTIVVAAASLGWFAEPVQGQAIGEMQPVPLDHFAPPAPGPLPAGSMSFVGLQPPISGDVGAHPSGGSLAIRDLEQMALANNPTIMQATRQIEALQGKHLQSGLYPNPILGYLGEEMGDEGSAGQQGIFVGQRFVTAGKLKLNRAVVSHEIQQAQHELDMQRRRVVNDVRARGYLVLIAQQVIELNQQLVQIGEAAVAAAQSLQEAKEVSRVDVLQARVEVNTASPSLMICFSSATAFCPPDAPNLPL